MVVENKHGMVERMNDVWTLPNGLRIVGERLPYLRSISIGVWLRVGSRMELPNENGLSHFLEHMVFKGTEKRTTRQIAEEMDAVGGQLNAFTGKESTCYYAKVIDEDVELAVDMLSDLTLHATLPEDELIKERGVILEEIAMDEDSPEDLVTELLSQGLFGDQSIGMPIMGTAALVSGYTRKELAAYRAKHYRPEDTVVALAGNYDPAQIEELMNRYFGGWSNPGDRTVLAPAQVLTGQLRTKAKDVEQLQLCMGFPGMAYGSEDIYPQAVLNNLLGGSMSSRLFQRIREELGMAYTIYSTPYSYLGCGAFVIYAGVSPQNGQRVLSEIDAELVRLLKDGLADKEFRDAKTQLRGLQVLSLESPGARMQDMGRSQLLLNRSVSPAEVLDKISAVTAEQVMDCAERIFGSKRTLAVVGRDVNGYQA